MERDDFMARIDAEIAALPSACRDQTLRASLGGWAAPGASLNPAAVDYLAECFSGLTTDQVGYIIRGACPGSQEDEERLRLLLESASLI